MRRERGAHRVFSSGAMLFEEGKIFRAAVRGLKFEWRKKKKENKKDCFSLSLSLSLHRRGGLSALSQGSLCPLLRANTRIFAREERERERERKEEEKERERERRESEREREIYSPALLCGCG